MRLVQAYQFYVHQFRWNRFATQAGISYQMYSICPCKFQTVLIHDFSGVNLVKLVGMIVATTAAPHVPRARFEF
jgi:hypothetical protein